MIRVDNVEISGWDACIRGMRNPLESWDKSDSYWTYIENAETGNRAKFEFFLGENDLALMRKLSAAGDDHGKFERFIDVYFDITAPLYWWKEFETYRAGVMEFPMDVEINSCSTMHKIHAREFRAEDFSTEHLTERAAECFSYMRRLYNHYRENFNTDGDKKWWWQMVQLLPASYNQTRTLKMTYQALKNMYFARRNHKLDEWRDLCKWVETLPYFREICIENTGA